MRIIYPDAGVAAMRPFQPRRMRNGSWVHFCHKETAAICTSISSTDRQFGAQLRHSMVLVRFQKAAIAVG